MTLAFVPIQLVADPLRGEGRNIGVIGTVNGQGFFRAAGLGADGTLDMAVFRAMSGLSVADSVVVPDWMEFFRCVADREATTLEGLTREMNRLAADGSGFAPGPGGEVAMGLREAPERAMERVFKRVVGYPRPEQVDRFPDALEWLLHHAELRSRPDFWQDAEVLLKTPAGPVTLTFDFALTSAPATGFRIVRYGADEKQTRRELKAALSEFGKAWKAGFLSANRSVILTDQEWPAGDLADQLAAAGVVVINPLAADSVQRVHALLQRPR